MTTEPEGPMLARITITRYLTDDDIVDHVSAEATDGTDLGLADALGMMTLAQHTLIASYSDEADS